MSETDLFAGIVGNGRALDSLRRALRSGILHNGYLFAGPAGVGKALAAGAFARALLCTGGSGPCGRCRSCALPAGAPHPDLAQVGPEAGRKSIGIAQIHELGSFLALSPAWGSRKAAVVDPADSLTDEAANALLKTLEEPPPGRAILLVTAHPGSLPATVRSRCRNVPFGALTLEETAAVLRGRGWPAEAASRAAVSADGSPGTALERDGEIWRQASERAAAILAALAAGDRGAAFALAESLREGREFALAALAVLVGWLREAARRRLLGEAPGSSALPGALAGLDEGRLVDLLEDGLAASRRLEANVNPKLALTVFFAAWGGDREAGRALRAAGSGGRLGT